ncbi:hypothetical protein VN97_g2313 [Penicillium thymicola]|uniref:Uncharacterized protein n=1 Tax=Penicillium thymicola TaxID=293382 RepID=A0AAI9TPH0_PENTH|nr:hypothetical protein VN97_g2313 [Penicillium thymicola]
MAWRFLELTAVSGYGKQYPTSHPGQPFHLYGSTKMMSFENVLSSTTPRYKYNHRGIDECVRVLRRDIDSYERESSGGTSNPCFIMDIDERSYNECFVNSEEKPPVLSSEVYNHAPRSTIVEVASPTHAVAARALNQIFRAWVQPYLLVDTGEAGFGRETITKKRAMSWTLNDPSSGKVLRLAKFAPNCPSVSGKLKLQLRDVYVREKKETDKDFVVTEKSMELLTFKDGCPVDLRNAARTSGPKPNQQWAIGPTFKAQLSPWPISGGP